MGKDTLQEYLGSKVIFNPSHYNKESLIKKARSFAKLHLRSRLREIEQVPQRTEIDEQGYNGMCDALKRSISHDKKGRLFRSLDSQVRERQFDKNICGIREVAEDFLKSHLLLGVILMHFENKNGIYETGMTYYPRYSWMIFENDLFDESKLIEKYI